MHRLALLVIYVVVFQEVLARLEILHLDGFLGFGDTLGDELALDRHILFHAQSEHQVLHALAAENTQQIVLEGEEKPRTAGVALAARPSSKLVIDAAGFVAFGSHDVQAAQRHNFLVLGIRLALEARVQLVPLLARNAVEQVLVREEVEMFVGDVLGLALVDLLGHPLFETGVFGHELGVAAEQNVGAAPGHVGRDRYRVLASRLRHDAGLALVVLGVQDLVLYAHPLENAR